MIQRVGTGRGHVLEDELLANLHHLEGGREKFFPRDVLGVLRELLVQRPVQESDGANSGDQKCMGGPRAPSSVWGVRR